MLHQALVSDADEVVGQLLDRVGGSAGLHTLGVVGDENGLGGLDNDETLLALLFTGVLADLRAKGLEGMFAPTHLLSVQTPLVGLEHDETLASNVQASALDLLDAVGVALVLVRVHNLLHLVGSNLTHYVSPRACVYFGPSLAARLQPMCAGGPCMRRVWTRRRCRGCDERTVKPADAAQTLLPSALKMAALSTLPVPTRLWCDCQHARARSTVDWAKSSTSCQRMLDDASVDGSSGGAKRGSSNRSGDIPCQDIVMGME